MIRSLLFPKILMETKPLLLADDTIAYIAGIIDGEGSIGIYKNRKYYVPKVTIANTNLDLLVYIKDCLGMGSITNQMPSINAKPRYQLCISGAKAVFQIIITVRRYLRVKTIPAQIVWAWCLLHNIYDRPKGNKAYPYGTKEADLINSIHRVNQKGLGICVN